MSTKPVTCRIQWLGGANMYLVPRIPKLDDSTLMIVQVAHNQRPTWSRWIMTCLDGSSECTIQSFYNSKQFINGGQLSSIPTPIRLCRVGPPADAAGPVAWDEVEGQWSCLMLLPNGSRISGQLDLDTISLNVVPGKTPVPKNHMWRIQFLKKDMISTEDVKSPDVPQLPKPILAPSRVISAPPPFEIRCRLITGKKKSLLCLNTDVNGCLILVRTNICANPAQWSIKRSGKFYTIQLVKNQRYLSNSPVGLSTIPAKWTIEDLPFAPDGEPLVVKSSLRCTIRPATRPELVFRADPAKPVITQSPSKKNKHKWKVEVLSTSLHIPSSSNVGGHQNQTIVQPSAPQIQADPDGSGSASTDDVCFPMRGPQHTANQLASSIATAGNMSDNPSGDGLPAPEKVDPKGRVTDWVKNLPSNYSSLLVIATPMGGPRAESPVAQVALPSDTKLPLEAKICRVQHILTGAFLIGTGKGVGLTECANTDVWVMKPWGPGYTFAVSALTNSTSSPRYLAPDPNGDGKTLSPSPYPATWEIAQKQERYTSAVDAEEMEWICKIRWPFTEERIRVDGPSKDSKGSKVRLSENNGSDELDRLSEYWRVQFLVA